MGFVRAVALDLDGTLAEHDRVSPEATFPRLVERFDAVVGENGAVLRIGAETRGLAPAVDAALVDALAAHGVPLRRGHVLLAMDAGHADAVLDRITELGLDCHSCATAAR